MSQSSQRSGLTKDETRTSLESFNWSLGFRAAFEAICASTGFIFVSFALSLGLEKERMGFIASAVSFACVLQMIGLIFTTRIRDKKAFIIKVGVVEPLLMIGAVLVVPFLPQGIRLYALGAVIFLAAAALYLVSPLTQDWIASTIPTGVMGRYLGRRFQVMSASIIVTTLIAGHVVERINKTNAAGVAEHISKPNTFGLACVLAVGGVFGIAAVLALRRATMPALSMGSHVTWSDILPTFKHRDYRRYIIAMLIYNAPFYIAVPYYQVFNLKILGMRESFIAYMFVAYYAVRILITPWLGRHVDRKGARWALLAFGPLYVLFFVGLVLSDQGRVWPTVVGWVLAGVADAAYSIGMTGALFLSVPRIATRPAFFAIFNLFALGIFGIGAILAVPILEALKDVHLAIGPLTLGQFQIFFGICTLMMIPCTLGALFLARQGRTRPAENNVERQPEPK